MLVFSFICTFCVSLFLNLSDCIFKMLTELYLSVFPCTLGLSIAAYAILIGFQSETINKLLQISDNGTKAFHVISASMIFNGLLQTLTIIISFVFQFNNIPLLFYISTFLACSSLIQIMDILLQLFALRTFVINSK